MNLKEKIFAWIWKNQAKHVDTLLGPIKTALLKEARGTVVEIGPGTGVNFKYLPSGISWVGVEPNDELRFALQKSDALPNRWKIYIDVGEVHSGTADTVVSTIVLCSVPNLPMFLTEVFRILKLGGTFIALEHVGSPRGTMRRGLQRLIKPLTRCLGGGCEPDRDIEAAIRSLGFSSITQTYQGDIAFARFGFKVPVVGIRAVK